MKTDTIAAIATPLSDSGIGIIRISGEDAIEVGDRIFRSGSGKKILSGARSHTLHHGYIVSDLSGDNGRHVETWEQKIVDEVMAVVMRAPKSYTTEDTVEINCHGGVLVMKKVLETAFKAGARMAEPGEFTRRAFLNGRMDLSEAEAVMDVISSRNEYALTSSVGQLRGALSSEIRQLRQEILHEIAFIESALDDPEHISLDGYREKLGQIVRGLGNRMEKLIHTADNGRLMKEGINAVIVGKPNVGKSSLLNLLAGEDRAIVTEVAGTTRDILEESVQLNGIGLNIMDTAGIRNTEDTVEKIGVERAREYAKRADLILYVVDASGELDEDDEEICGLIADKTEKNKVIVLLNKTDLEAAIQEDKIRKMMNRAIGEAAGKPTGKSTQKSVDGEPGGKGIPVIKTSMKDNTGIAELEQAVQDMFFSGNLPHNGEIVITSLRHKQALQEAYQSIRLVEQSIRDDMPEDFYSIDLMSAYASLGTIIGEEVGEDLVNEIFSKFCLGK